MYPLSVHFFVDDLRKSMEFYTAALGFEVRTFESPETPQFASLQRGPDNVMLSQLGAFSEVWPLERLAAARKASGAGASTVYMESPDIEAECERARAAGAKVLEGIVDRPWGQKEFVVEDPDGNWLTLWQVVSAEH